MKDWYHIQHRLAELWPQVAELAPEEPYRTEKGGRTAFEALLGRVYFNLAGAQELNTVTTPYHAPADKHSPSKYITYSALCVRMRKAYFPDPKHPDRQPLIKMWRAYIALLDNREISVWREAFRRGHYIESPSVPGKKLTPGVPIVQAWFQAMERVLNERLTAKPPRQGRKRA